MPQKAVKLNKIEKYISVFSYLAVYVESLSWSTEAAIYWCCIWNWSLKLFFTQENEPQDRMGRIGSGREDHFREWKPAVNLSHVGRVSIWSAIVWFKVRASIWNLYQTWTDLRCGLGSAPPPVVSIPMQYINIRVGIPVTGFSQARRTCPERCQFCTIQLQTQGMC